MFKNNLLLILKELNDRKNRTSDLMSDCINVKLDRSLENYQRTIMETCKYILSRNPVLMMKDITKEYGSKGEDEDD